VGFVGVGVGVLVIVGVGVGVFTKTHCEHTPSDSGPNISVKIIVLTPATSLTNPS
jgi:hypothetical protein